MGDDRLELKVSTKPRKEKWEGIHGAFVNSGIGDRQYDEKNERSCKRTKGLQVEYRKEKPHLRFCANL